MLSTEGTIMSEQVETVVVIRKDHPEGKVTINRADMKPGDVEYGSEPVAPAKKKSLRG